MEGDRAVACGIEPTAVILFTVWSDDKIDYARLLREQGSSLGEITSKTGIPKTSLHRYLTLATEQE